MEYTTTRNFQRICLATPCHGCGSREHALLKPSETRDTTSVHIYEYECKVVKHVPLYPSSDMSVIKINYYLEVERYAADCQYNEEEAIERAPSLGRIFENRADYPPYMDSFMNAVRVLCRRYSTQTRT